MLTLISCFSGDLFCKFENLLSAFSFFSSEHGVSPDGRLFGRRKKFLFISFTLFERGFPIAGHRSTSRSQKKRNVYRDQLASRADGLRARVEVDAVFSLFLS